MADEMQDDVLAAQALRQSSIQADTHGPGTALYTGLGCQNVQQFALPDAPGQGSERAVSTRVAVADGHRQTGQHKPQLRRHHMHDPMPRFSDLEMRDADSPGVFPQRDHMGIAQLKGVVATRVGTDRMIGRREAQFRVSRRQPTIRQAPKCAAVEIGQDVAIDVQQREALAQVLDDMALPDFFKQGARHRRISC